MLEEAEQKTAELRFEIKTESILSESLKNLSHTQTSPPHTQMCTCTYAHNTCTIHVYIHTPCQPLHEHNIALVNNVTVKGSKVLCIS